MKDCMLQLLRLEAVQQHHLRLLQLPGPRLQAEDGSPAERRHPGRPVRRGHLPGLPLLQVVAPK